MTKETTAVRVAAHRRATLTEIALVLGVPTIVFLSSSVRWRLLHHGAVVLFLWLGYAIPAVASRAGIAVACFVSIALRVSVHLYQGNLAFVSVLPIAIVLTWYYVGSGRLWPTVVAHVIVDALGLARLAA